MQRERDSSCQPKELQGKKKGKKTQIISAERKMKVPNWKSCILECRPWRIQATSCWLCWAPCVLFFRVKLKQSQILLLQALEEKQPKCVIWPIFEGENENEMQLLAGQLKNVPFFLKEESLVELECGHPCSSYPRVG